MYMYILYIYMYMYIYALTCDAGVWGYDQHTVQVLQRMQRESLGQTMSSDGHTVSDHHNTTEKVCQRG